MATTTKIRVTATDNELYILASTASAPWFSSEICHIKSGKQRSGGLHRPATVGSVEWRLHPDHGRNQLGQCAGVQSHPHHWWR